MEKIIAMLEKMGEDVDYRIREIEEEKPELIITIDDFEGFDEDSVRALIDLLEKYCIYGDSDFYSYYYFEEFDVQLGYSSYDI